MNEKHLIVATIPAYEEEATIAKVSYPSNEALCGSVIVCDDGPIDMTCEIAKSFGDNACRSNVADDCDNSVGVVMEAADY